MADHDHATRRVSVRRSVQILAGRPVGTSQDPPPPRIRRPRPRHDHQLDRWRRRLRLDSPRTDRTTGMFCNWTGRFLNPESLTQLFDRIVRTDVPRIRFHDLRNSECVQQFGRHDGE